MVFRIFYNGYNERKDLIMTISNNKYVNKLKQKFEEDPITTILVGAMAVTAAAKLIDAASAAQGRRAYAKQVQYRVNRQI
jgi:hypothetical protein